MKGKKQDSPLKKALTQQSRGDDEEIVECPHCQKINHCKNPDGYFAERASGEIVTCDNPSCRKKFRALKKAFFK